MRAREEDLYPRVRAREEDLYPRVRAREEDLYPRVRARGEDLYPRARRRAIIRCWKTPHSPLSRMRTHGEPLSAHARSNCLQCH